MSKKSLNDALDDRAFYIEDIILSHGARGIDRIRHAVSPGYCMRAARLMCQHRGRVLIGTGFPVGDAFETDGPVGAIALYDTLAKLGSTPVFVCAPPISLVLKKRYRTHEIPVLDWEESRGLVRSVLEAFRPALVVSVERPGITAHGRYYNMRGVDISQAVAKFDLFFQWCRCPTIAFGDGGNEIGMGNVKDALSVLPVVPSVTPCDELVIATVSNWGVYGVIAALSLLLDKDLLGPLTPKATTEFLVAHGGVDGVTCRPAHSEDGFPVAIGKRIIQQLRDYLKGGHHHGE